MQPPDPALPLDGPLWRFAQRVYSQPGVAQACLALQQRFDADVNLLLFAAWLGAERATPLPAPLARQAQQRVAAWHDEIVRPLRAVRQRMKTGPKPAPSGATEALRDALKAVEIGSERIELALLETIAPEAPQGPPDAGLDAIIRGNLRTVLALSAGGDALAEADRPVRAIARASLAVTGEAVPCGG
ncbi:TIGR02444 family protein [Inquilinus sp. CA228]|uniref:TIGR02444 family protein n=1 Tax=Inquilinus sp. CA228 TaxID=3455609 RepID=UPI003F8D3A42